MYKLREKIPNPTSEMVNLHIFVFIKKLPLKMWSIECQETDISKDPMLWKSAFIEHLNPSINYHKILNHEYL